MNDLNILKEVGLKEVARKTHIEPEFLHYIINKDFDKLLRLNVKGYIKIIEREYGIDFESWFLEFNEYKKQNFVDDGKKPKVNPKIPAYTANGEPAKKVSGGVLGWVLWLFIMAMFFGLAYYFDAHKYIEQLPKIFDDENASASYSTTSVVQEVKKNMNVVEQNTTSVIIKKDENTSIQISITPKSLEQNSSDTNSTLPLLNTPEPLAKDKNLTSEANSTQTHQADLGKFLLKAPSVTFAPRASVWAGFIDLNSGKKSSKTSSESYDIDTTGRWLVVFGNGNIELRSKTQTLKFDPNRAVRFLVQNGEVRSLSYDEFVGLNKGKSW
ncbi:helix-turn-helix domain-containing protein [Campylobacter mucosalis]|uniref:Phosphatidylglycerophosphate synthase n=1 Tax=Campylobacter mucosalis CCUG 21559 TaxID=1032067 RepID=A0A6G5QE15_9BACT|nr:phosphatidylglycerophosphate synthase [Campylobacter mucosalis]QCD43925.1 hypothetical protein CMUC_0105 [Campylobacter mucosalis CCUG 21559]